MTARSSSGAFIVNDSRPPFPDNYVERLVELVAADRCGEAIELFMTEAVGVPPEFLAQMRADPSWEEMETIAHTLPYDGIIMGETMSGELLPNDRWTSLTVPTVVLNSNESPLFLHDGANALANLLSSTQYRTLDGQDHDIDPEALAPILIE